MIYKRVYISINHLKHLLSNNVKGHSDINIKKIHIKRLFLKKQLPSMFKSSFSSLIS